LEILFVSDKEAGGWKSEIEDCTEPTHPTWENLNWAIDSYLQAVRKWGRGTESFTTLL